MGAWGAGSFDNDDAGDWAFELEEGGLNYIRETLETITQAEQDDYLEAPDSSNAVAAAEVVAALNGKPLKELPEEVTTWIEGKPKPKSDLIGLAKQAVSRIAQESELKELWDEAEPENAKSWRAAMDDLLKRLA